jgi:hypothetical protein
LGDAYAFDESQIMTAIAEQDGEYRFTKRIHHSNIHLMLAPVKFLAPRWPTDPSQARISKLTLAKDAQLLDWREISWRIKPRDAFSVTSFFERGEPLGELTHLFLDRLEQ